MSKSYWAALAFNALVAVMAVAGLASYDSDAMDVALLLAVVAMVVNSALLIRGATRVAEAPPQPAPQSLDAHQLLRIDERIEALERAEARTLRALVDEGVVRSPAAATGDAPGRASQPLPTGRG